MHRLFLLPVISVLFLVPSAAGAADLDAGLREQVARQVEEPLSDAVGEHTTRLLEAASRRAMARRTAQDSPAPRATCALDSDDVFECVVRSDVPASAPAARAD